MAAAVAKKQRLLWREDRPLLRRPLLPSSPLLLSRRSTSFDGCTTCTSSRSSPRRNGRSMMLCAGRSAGGGGGYRGSSITWFCFQSGTAFRCHASGHFSTPHSVLEPFVRRSATIHRVKKCAPGVACAGRKCQLPF